jgi:hypothetical protein
MWKRTRKPQKRRIAQIRGLLALYFLYFCLLPFVFLKNKKTHAEAIAKAKERELTQKRDKNYSF